MRFEYLDSFKKMRYIKRMKRTLIFLVMVFFALLVSCASKPVPEEITVSFEENPEESTTLAVILENLQEEPEEAGEPAEEDFDPATITQEVFDTTKYDLQKLIADLNQIIKNKNFNTWVSYLGGEYLDKISSEEFLAGISSQPFLKNKKITLASAKDYFDRVVVPSRANDRVDDIAFVSPIRVKVYTINNKGERLRLYDLENLGNGWKIIN
jgi:hypothetical protein